MQKSFGILDSNSARYFINLNSLILYASYPTEQVMAQILVAR